LGLDALIPIGGEDTLGVGAKLAALGAPVVGIPKTIDRDLGSTDYTLGFDTSMRTCAEIIERSQTPAGSHHWVQVVEVMGRHAGAAAGSGWRARSARARTGTRARWRSGTRSGAARPRRSTG